MKATRRFYGGRVVVPGLTVILLLGACGRGVSEQRVASRGSEPGAEVTEAPLPPGTTTSTIRVEPPAMLPTEPTTTPPSTAPPPASTTTTAKPSAGDPCAALTLTEFPLSVAGGKPTELTVAPDGAVWFTDNGHAAIGRLAPDGTVRMFPLSLNRQPAGIAVGAGGVIWFTQYAWYDAGRSPAPGVPPPDPAATGPPAIGRIGPDGTLTDFPLPTADGNRMGAPDMGSVPRGIIAGPDGRLWVADDRSAAIHRVTTKGAVSQLLTVPDVPARDWEALGGLASGDDGSVWLAAPSSNRILRISCAA